MTAFSLLVYCGIVLSLENNTQCILLIIVRYSSYHSIQCHLVHQKSSILTESLSCCVFLCPVLLLQRLVGMLDEVLADEKQHE